MLDASCIGKRAKKTLQLNSNKKLALSLKIEPQGTILPDIMWQRCVTRLQDELPSQQFNTWIRPLHASQEGDAFKLYAPNRFIKDFVSDKFADRISELLVEEQGGRATELVLEIGSASPASGTADNFRVLEDTSSAPALSGLAVDRSSYQRTSPDGSVGRTAQQRSTEISAASTLGGQRADVGFTSVTTNPQDGSQGQRAAEKAGNSPSHQHNLVESYTFESFVEGKSNQLALAAAHQVAENPGDSYNPLFLYGGVGLGKTHLMHAVGNALRANKPNAKVVYLHSERFVADMVKALQLNAISDFKRFYRTVDALLIDDIQFFAKKDRSQEEFFHTFNALLEGGQQMILTCDRYPKEIDGLEERLKSRFGWGLTVAVEPPELETRVAILMKKATQARIDLPPDAAFFIAQRVRSNVRELEGALKRVIASAHFTSRPIDIDLIKESLKDLLALQDKQVSLDNIQRTVAEYFKIKIADLMSRRRSRSVARPRQVAMALAKELTNHSLPEIGDSFGGRDHTTVLHACRKIKELRETSSDMREDYKNLLRSLTT